MTVVIAVRCADGLVVGADSQITESERGFSYPGSKLHPLGERAVWGGSGSRSVLADLEQEFGSDGQIRSSSQDVGRELQQRMLPVLRHHYDHFIPEVPGHTEAVTPSAYVLAAGYEGDEPWIVEINPHGMLNPYGDIGFHAIGSGAPMAQQAGTLLAHFRMTRRKAESGLLVVVRVLDALQITSPSVGGPLDVYMLRPNGGEYLATERIEEAREKVERWVEGERQALDDLEG